MKILVLSVRNRRGEVLQGEFRYVKQGELWVHCRKASTDIINVL